MPTSPLHEVLIELLRQVPEHLAPALARALPGLDPNLPVTFVDTSANEPLVVERRADLVMLLGNPKRPELAVVMEIQLNEDGDKPYTWPQYVVAMHTRWRCEVELLVIAPNPRVARWANQPMKLSRRGSQIIPLVLGTDDFPRLDVETLAGHPHATVFHALLHCRDKGDLPLLQQALTDVNTLPQPDRIGYYEILRSCLAPSFLKLAEVAMSLEHTRFYQEFVERLKSEGEGNSRVEPKAKSWVCCERSLANWDGVWRCRAQRPWQKWKPSPSKRWNCWPKTCWTSLRPADLDAWLARH
jgi:hypothetical protein